MNRFQYLLRRLMLALPTFVGITIVCFLLTRILASAPGGLVDMKLAQMQGGGGGEAGSSVNVQELQENDRKKIESELNLDKPLLVQYKIWAWDECLGMKAKSERYKQPAYEVIKDRIPVSIWFGITAFFLSYLVCIPLGIAKALRHGSTFDITSSILVFTAYAVPAFAIGMLLKTFLCGTVEGLWDIFPLGGTESAEALQNGGLSLFFSRAYHMILPITAYVMTSFALLTIMMKNSLMEQMSSEYVRTVLAKGATRKRAIWGHAFRNALIPIATGFGSVLGVLFAGSMIIETIFEIRGMGLMSLEALQGQDYSIFMAMIVITAGIQLIGNLISDFCYMLIDPRINFD
jgi:microcin C transport system permease protein